MHAYNEFAGGNHIRLRKPVLLTNTCLIVPIRIAQADWANTKIFREEKIMFKTLSQKEMMNVNGGFKYIPVYDFYYTSSGLERRFVKTVQVPSNDKRKYIERYTYVNGVRIH